MSAMIIKAVETEYKSRLLEDAKNQDKKDKDSEKNK